MRIQIKKKGEYGYVLIKNIHTIRNMKNIKMPNSVCWNITSRCNDVCKFCYRDRYSGELSFEEQKRVIESIAKAGIKKVTFAGGEPLLVSRVNELILYAKKLGMLVSMTTNAIVLDEKPDEYRFLLENLDWLTFSLDGADDEVQSKMTRNARHATRIKKLLALANEYPKKNCKIKINTIISGVNKYEVIDLVEVIKEYGVKRWKLFQFTPLRGAAIEYKDEFSIDADEYRAVCESIKNEVDDNIILSFSDSTDIESAHFVIFPNGDIRIASEGEDKPLGNVLNDKLEDIWKEGGYIAELHAARTDFINIGFNKNCA